MRWQIVIVELSGLGAATISSDQWNVLTLETTFPGTVVFNLELLLTSSASPFGSIVFKSLPFDRTGMEFCIGSAFRPAALGRFIAGA